jgi:hypothetical protein
VFALESKDILPNFFQSSASLTFISNSTFVAILLWCDSTAILLRSRRYLVDDGSFDELDNYGLGIGRKPFVLPTSGLRRLLQQLRNRVLRVLT